MPSPLPVDLHERVVSAVSEGASCHQAAARFGASVSSASRWSEQFRQEGQLAPKPSGGDHATHRIEAQVDSILTTYAARAAIFLHKLRDALAERGVPISTSSLSRSFARHGIAREKGDPRRRAGSGGREGGQPVLVRGPARSRSGPTRVPRQDRPEHEDDPALRACATQQALPGGCAVPACVDAPEVQAETLERRGA